MITRIIDGETNDWIFGRGKQGYLAEDKAIQQNVKTKLQSFINNCFFDMGEGIDWFFHLGAKNPEGLQLAIVDKIASLSGVTDVQLVEFENTDRMAKINYQLSTVWDKNISGNITV